MPQLDESTPPLSLELIKKAQEHERGGRLEEARALYTDHIRQFTNDIAVQRAYGKFLQETVKDFPAAERQYKKCLTLDLHYDPLLLNDLGCVLHFQRKHNEAEFYFLNALETDPDYINARSNLASLYYRTRQLQKAEYHYHFLLASRKAPAFARHNYAYLLLLQRKYRDGFHWFESRLEHKPQPTFPFGRWQGEPLRERTLIIVWEEGYGDTIQFSRYLSLLKKAGAGTVIFICQSPLGSLMSTLTGVDHVLLQETAEFQVPDTALWCRVMSLPHLLRLENAPAPELLPYLSVPKERRTSKPSVFDTSLFKVGLIWKGSPDGDAKRHLYGEPVRCLPSPHLLKPLWDISGIRFFDLQTPDTARDSPYPTDQPIENVGQYIHDFSDTAALLDPLDLIITIDTATAHLAGALGKPVWTLLSAEADWRWHLESDISPWYPTMRLFRQKNMDDWSEVIDRVKIALHHRLEPEKI